MEFSIIGGADGPTSIFMAGKIGGGWLNLSGTVIVALMLLPNIIYSVKFRDMKNQCQNKVMNLMEQIGRYVSIFLMIFNIGIAEFGFSTIGAFLVYVFGNLILVTAYLVTWIFYFKKQTLRRQMILAVIPTCIFLVSGITLMHVFLIISAVIFGIGHIYVTYQGTSD